MNIKVYWDDDFGDWQAEVNGILVLGRMWRSCLDCRPWTSTTAELAIAAVAYQEGIPAPAGGWSGYVAIDDWELAAYCDAPLQPADCSLKSPTEDKT